MGALSRGRNTATQTRAWWRAERVDKVQPVQLVWTLPAGGREEGEGPTSTGVGGWGATIHQLSKEHSGTIAGFALQRPGFKPWLLAIYCHVTESKMLHPLSLSLLACETGTMGRVAMVLRQWMRRPSPAPAPTRGSTLTFSDSPSNFPCPGAATSGEHGENEAAFLQLPMSDD